MIKKKIGGEKKGDTVLRQVEKLDNALDTKVEKHQPSRADFLRMDEQGVGVHGFGRKVVVDRAVSLFDKPAKDRVIVLPVDIITFISFEYDINWLKNKIIKAYKDIKDLVFEDDTLFAEVDIVKKNNIGLQALNDVRRSLDEYCSTDNIPASLVHLTNGIKDPVRIKNGATHIELNASVIITETILKNMVYIPELGGSKEDKKDAIKELTNKFLKNVELTDIKIGKRKKLYFALVFDYSEEDLFIEFNTENFVAANTSMTHVRYQELAEEQLATIRKRTKVKFVRTSDIVNSKTRDIVYARNDMNMMRNPIIELVELNDTEVRDILTKTKDGDKKGSPIFMYEDSKIPAHLAMYGAKPRKVIDQKSVKLLFSSLYTGEPVFFKDPDKDRDYLCPNIKQLSLFALTGFTTLPVKVGVVSTNKDIAVSFETSK